MKTMKRLAQTSLALGALSAFAPGIVHAQPAQTPAAETAEAPPPAEPATTPSDAMVAPPQAAPAAEAPPSSAAVELAPVVPSSKPKPPPYSLPFQLRPVAPGNVVRSDSTLGLYENAAGKSGTVAVSTLLASYKLSDSFSPLVRLGVVQNSPPGAAKSAMSLMNPVLGALYGIKLAPELRLGLFLGVTLPIGGGGGDTPKPERRAANAAGIAARNAMDNAMFAVNDFTVFPGIGFAYISGGFTAQIEATVLQLTRVRGEKAQPDSSRTNFTSGLHLGYFLIPELSIGAELRHQRWLSTPKAVEQNAAARDTTTFAVGPRLHLKTGEKTWIRPGVSFSMPFDKPNSDSKYKNIQLDIPFVF